MLQKVRAEGGFRAKKTLSDLFWECVPRTCSITALPAPGMH